MASESAAVPPAPVAAAAAFVPPADTAEQASSTAQEAAADAAEPSMMRTWSSSQRPPPSPFEGVPLLSSGLPPRPPPVRSSGAEGPDAPSGGTEGELEAGANGNRRSPRGLQPTKSAMRVRLEVGEQPPGAAAAAADTQQKGLSWADTHGKAIHHVQEYQTSEHGSEGFRKYGACSCCVQ